MPPVTDSHDFRPPSAEQVRQHLSDHPPTGPSRVMLWLPLVALGLLVGVLLSRAGPLSALLPWLLLGGLLGVTAFRAQWMRDLEGRCQQAQELSMHKQHARALRLAWRLIPRTQTVPHLHARSTAVMAHSLDQVLAADAAIVVYDFLIERMSEGHPGVMQFRARRAVAQFLSDRLLDGDVSLRRLRADVSDSTPPATRAAIRLAELLQQVRTNHFTDALQTEPGLLEQLRPLGLEAAYGYGLMALCHLRQPDTGDPHVSSRHASQARKWWTDATLLLPVSTLTRRLPELARVPELLAARSQQTL
jgi:hypothetical protein